MIRECLCEYPVGVYSHYSAKCLRRELHGSNQSTSGCQELKDTRSSSRRHKFVSPEGSPAVKVCLVDLQEPYQTSASPAPSSLQAQTLSWETIIKRRKTHQFVLLSCWAKSMVLFTFPPSEQGQPKLILGKCQNRLGLQWWIQNNH